MLLSRINRLREDDRGSALIAVLALAAVTAVVAVTVGSVSVNSLRFTNDTSAGVEARAAAEAGIARAELALRTTTGCSAAAGVFTSTTAPEYRVEVSYDRGAGWEVGCPTNDARRSALSTGYANRALLAGSRVEDGRVMEAVYQYIPEYVEVPDIDPAVYAYSIDGVLQKFVLDSADFTISADVQIKTGDFECTNNASVAGDVILANGGADLTSCTIAGTLHVTKGAGIDGAVSSPATSSRAGMASPARTRPSASRRVHASTGTCSPAGTSACSAAPHRRCSATLRPHVTPPRK